MLLLQLQNAKLFMIPLCGANALPFYSTQTLCTKLYNLRSNRANRSFNEVHHSLHDALLRALTANSLPTQVTQPDQSTHPLVLDPSQPQTHPLLVLYPRRHLATRVARQQQRLALRHVLARSTAPHRLELRQSAAEGVVGKCFWFGECYLIRGDGRWGVRLGQRLRTGGDGAHEAVAQVLEIGIPSRYYAQCRP